MKIAILGTKGIPNNYGGYEQFAEFISQRLVMRGHQVTVYNPSFHAYREPAYQGVTIIRKFSPEAWIGGSANFIYDFLCLRDALQRDFDVIYEAGYHSVAPSYRLLSVRGKRRPVVITNMDGLEYNRSKWSNLTQQLIRRLERIAVEDSPFMISDNLGIQEYYRREFNRDSFFLSYGADPVNQVDELHLKAYNIEKYQYLMLVARFEPENNLEMALDGLLTSGQPIPFLVVGNHQTRYGRFLKTKYRDDRIRFVGGIYNKPVLDSLRHFAAAYFHGHSVGGTNPSLLEAMACGAYIFAHDNPFNRKVLFDSARYFKNVADVKELLGGLASGRDRDASVFRADNVKRIQTDYNWDTIVEQHEALFMELIRSTEGHN